MRRLKYDWLVTVKWRVSHNSPMGRSTVRVVGYDNANDAKIAGRIRAGAPANATATARKDHVSLP